MVFQYFPGLLRRGFACSCGVLLLFCLTAEVWGGEDELVADESSRLHAGMDERWRIRHELKYGDPDIIPLRVAARSYQRHVRESRDDLTAYLQAHYPDYRAAERNMARAFDDIRAMEAELQVLDREIGGEARAAGSEERIRHLQAERQRLDDLLQQRRVESRELVAELALLRRELALQHEQGRELWQIERTMQAAFDQAHQALHSALDRHPAVVRFDRQRIHQAHSSRSP